MAKPNITALKQLRRVVMNAPDDLLHMRTWKEESPCGTARCAAGWAAVDPWFNQHGFVAGSNGVPMKAGEDEIGTRHWGHRFLQQFFRLTGQQVEHLFAIGVDAPFLDNPHSVSKRQVLRQIDRILNGEPTKPYRMSRAKAARR